MIGWVALAKSLDSITDIVYGNWQRQERHAAVAVVNIANGLDIFDRGRGCIVADEEPYPWRRQPLPPDLRRLLRRRCSLPTMKGQASRRLETQPGHQGCGR